MQKEQTKISSWLALFCWLHKADVSDEHFGRRQLLRLWSWLQYNSCTNGVTPLSTVASHFLFVEFIGSSEFLGESTSRLPLLSATVVLGKQL